ncbi:hypothetical protein DAPPUDRAFT_245535 [Daphnia pulex]|uniref:Uncharacterized protein n=1 Tax=Daphnia pulex TaxID=6669 RepID=E9GNJ6_DAPPU|nr:hypothetical protein DAPPUDRAFT_272295 [Daphnia pulex]EFX78781.1 hypothetical protein DAPPUDRAFT_245535 [Daphnia pulex]|eukprot:EFX61665.1 hypothetical protein DAPPUDRAFT_272295 [Daphnia pulex]
MTWEYQIDIPMTSNATWAEPVRDFSTLQIYRRRPSVNILCQAMREHLYPTNLPPEAN